MALLAACGTYQRRVDVRLADDFPALPPTADIDVWVGENDVPKVAIAIISSHRTADRSRQAREAQLEELRNRARGLGANAIENIRVETAEVEGIVTDPRVPFTAFKQGEFELHFVRGTAVHYFDDVDTSVTP